MSGINSLSHREASEILRTAMNHISYPFASLPAELADQIVSYWSKNEILTLVRVRKSTCDQIMPWLRKSMYKFVSLKVDLKRNMQHPTTANYWALTKVHLFMRALLLQPETGRNVEFFSIEADLNSFRHQMLYQAKIRGVTERDLQSAREYIQLTHDEPPDGWLQRLNDRNLDAFVGVILSLLENLRSLRLPVWLNANVSCVGKALDLHAESFHQLKRIDFSYGSRMTTPTFFGDMTCEYFLPLFRLASLEDASLVLPSIGHRRDMIECPTPAPPAAKALKSLRLHRTHMHEQVLEQVLRLCPNLTHLSYEYEFEYTGWRKLDVGTLGRAVRSLAPTLEKLELPFDVYVDSTLDNVNEETIFAGEFGSLTTMSSLQYLDVSPMVLFGGGGAPTRSATLASKLPASLRGLRLRDGTCNVERSWRPLTIFRLLEQFLRDDAWKEVCPNLETITWHSDEEPGNMEESEAELMESELRKICSEKGLNWKWSASWLED
jgi:hypothetical protein